MLLISAVLAATLAAGPAKPTPAPPAAAPAPTRTAPAPSLTPRVPRLLVLDFAVQGEAGKELSRTLSDVAVREVNRAGGFKVLSQADVLTQLSVERQRVMMGCAADRSCMAEIAGAVDADRTLSGSVTKLGDGYFVTATLVDSRKIVTVGGAEETLRSARSEELLEAVRRVVYRAVTGRPREAQGIIEFNVAEVGARILLDGVELGRGPFQDTRRVADGSHRVVVAKEGYATWENVLRLEPGDRATVAPQLVSVGGGSKVMGWSAVSAGVLGVALTGVAIWKESDARSQYDRAGAMLGAGGILPVAASAQAYQDALGAGRSSHQAAVAFGVGAGVAVGTSLVLGYLSYRQTGEVGPFRF